MNSEGVGKNEFSMHLCTIVYSVPAHYNMPRATLTSSHHMAGLRTPSALRLFKLDLILASILEQVNDAASRP
jgi:hypothetical protein